MEPGAARLAAVVRGIGNGIPPQDTRGGCAAGSAFEAWEGLRTRVMVESIRITIDGVASARRFYIALPPDSQHLGQAIRSHWEIKNRLRWCLDVTLQEDTCRIFTDRAPAKPNIVRKIVMNLLRLNLLKRTLPKKRLKTCLNQAVSRKNTRHLRSGYRVENGADATALPSAQVHPQWR